jgi:DEAD/DEAH box helicase domain-containing protein
VSTNALELGIDIGALDVAVMAGYLGRSPRSGRRRARARSGRSAAVLVAPSAPIDRSSCAIPSISSARRPNTRSLDNLHILLDHVKCAAFELPFTAADTFGSINVQEILAVLAEEGFVHMVDGTWQWTQESYPANAVSLRSVTSDNFVVVDITDEEHVIGETDFTSGPSTLHEKAIYIIEGQLFQVERLDFDGRKAFVRAVECDYYTDAITHTKVTILETFSGPGPQAPGLRSEENSATVGAADIPRASGLVPGALASASHGEVHVVSRVVGFKKIKFYTNENVGSGELELPEQEMHTTSYWLTIPREVLAALPDGTADKRDGVVGLAYAMHNIAPMLLMCDRHDLGLSVDGANLEGGARLGGQKRGGKLRCARGRADHLPVRQLSRGIGLSEPLFALHETGRPHARADRHVSVRVRLPSCVGPEARPGRWPSPSRRGCLKALVAARAAA